MWTTLLRSSGSPLFPAGSRCISAVGSCLMAKRRRIEPRPEIHRQAVPTTPGRPSYTGHIDFGLSETTSWPTVHLRPPYPPDIGKA